MELRGFHRKSKSGDAEN